MERKNDEKTFRHFAERVLHYKERKAKATFAQAKYVMLDPRVGLIPHFGDMPIIDITEDDIEDFLTRVKDAGFTVYDHKKYLKSVFKRARKMRVVVPELDINVHDAAKGRGKVFTRSELARLLWACRSFTRTYKGEVVATSPSAENKAYLKNYAIQIRLAYTSGMRRGECAGFRWEFIDFKTGWVYLPPWFQKTKTTVDGAFKLNRGVLRILAALHRRPDRDTVLVFPDATNNHRGFQRLLKRAGISGRARFHDLRYTCTTNLLRSKKLISTQHAMKLLRMGHDTIKKYTVIQEDVADYAANGAIREAI